jgi:tetratricopeptide (TPR) repeat protein
MIKPANNTSATLLSRRRFSAFWLSLIVSVASLQVTAKSFTQQKTDALPAFTAQERELKGGETHSYRLVLAEGQFFYGLVEQKEIDVSIAVFAPDGRQIADTDSPNDRWGTEPVLLIADKSGDYRVEVRAPNSKVAPGRYEIRLVSLREATPEDKNLVSAQRLFEEAEHLGGQQNAAAKRASLEKYQQALQLFAASGETYRQALTLRAMVGRFAQLSDFRNVIKYGKEALSLAQSLHDRRLEGSIETFLGGASDFLGEVKEALAHYQRAVVLARENGNKATEASALNNIGKIYSDASDQQKALEYYLQALPLYQPLANPFAEGITLNNIGIAYKQLGNQVSHSIIYSRPCRSFALLEQRARSRLRSVTSDMLTVAWPTTPMHSATTIKPEGSSSKPAIRRRKQKPSTCWARSTQTRINRRRLLNFTSRRSSCNALPATFAGKRSRSAIWAMFIRYLASRMKRRTTSRNRSRYFADSVI